MRLLVDKDIRVGLQNPAGTALAYLEEGKPVQVRQLNDTHVRSASLDLTIGEIFVPASQSNDLGGSNCGKREHSLKQGHTVVIRTRERLRMGSRRAAIAFPPSHVSMKGLLMTNPGHVDPGYEGPLHCTVINMGHESYALAHGDKIMRTLFFELDDEDQSTPSPGGLPNGSVPSPITSELLARLSVDFVDVERRAKSIANEAVASATIRATVISALIPVMAGFVMAVFSPLQGMKDDIVKLRSDLSGTSTKIEEKEDFHTLENKLTTLNVQFAKEDKISERLKALEDRISAQPASTGDRKAQ